MLCLGFILDNCNVAKTNQNLGTTGKKRQRKSASEPQVLQVLELKVCMVQNTSYVWVPVIHTYLASICNTPVLNSHVLNPLCNSGGRGRSCWALRSGLVDCLDVQVAGFNIRLASLFSHESLPANTLPFTRRNHNAIAPCLPHSRIISRSGDYCDTKS